MTSKSTVSKVYTSKNPKVFSEWFFLFRLNVHIEKGTVVMANAVINACTEIGKHCIINTGCIVEHDNMIEDYVHISPNSVLGGTVKIGECTHVGIGATVKNNITICENCIIGAGAAVVKDIEEKGIYIGVPGKRA